MRAGRAGASESAAGVRSEATSVVEINGAYWEGMRSPKSLKNSTTISRFLESDTMSLTGRSMGRDKRNPLAGNSCTGTFTVIGNTAVPEK